MEVIDPGFYIFGDLVCNMTSLKLFKSIQRVLEMGGRFARQALSRCQSLDSRVCLRLKHHP